MTNTYNTGNPIGSTDPRDLYDNASNFDEGMNKVGPSFTDRLGVLRKTWNGMETEFDLAQAGRVAEFHAFLVASGYVSLGNYAAGLNFTAYNQYMARDGFFYRPAPSSIPFTTTGTWAGGDEDLFVLFSADEVLRRDLANDTDPAKGADLIGYRGRRLSEKLNERVSARDFGAVGDGQTDDTAAINAALATGRNVWLPKGVYLVSDAIQLGINGAFGQKLYGDGEESTILRVADNFNLAANGVISITTHMCCAEGFKIEFPASGIVSRSTIPAWPAAVQGNGHTRLTFRDIRIVRASTGFDLRGNTGGTVLESVEVSAFYYGFRIHGALDSVYFQSCHFWPFGLTDPGYEQAIEVYYDGVTIAAEIGVCDGLSINGFTTFRARVVLGVAGEGPLGTISNLNLDGAYGRLEMSAGLIAASSVYSTTSESDDYALLVVGGQLELGNYFFETATNLTQPLVHVNGVSAIVMLSNGSTRGHHPGVVDYQVSAGSLCLSNVFINHSTNLVRSAPFVRQVGGRLSVTGLRTQDIGAGSGVAIEIGADDRHMITNNQIVGWGMSIPAGAIFGDYSNNGVTTTGNAILAETVKRRFYSGVIGGDGTAVFAHGVGGLHNSVVTAAVIHGASVGAVHTGTLNYIDGSNIGISGQAGNNYRVLVEFV